MIIIRGKIKIYFLKNILLLKHINNINGKNIAKKVTIVGLNDKGPIINLLLKEKKLSPFQKVKY
jgi:hypothetical protein